MFAIRVCFNQAFPSSHNLLLILPRFEKLCWVFPFLLYNLSSQTMTCKQCFSNFLRAWQTIFRLLGMTVFYLIFLI